jgi:AcrR family transcriptional regulator
VIEKERFSVGELVRRTGVPASTVHHYLRLGLLPTPQRSRANRFLYDEGHVRALMLVRLLRERRRLRLDAIRRVLPDLLLLQEDQALRPEIWDRVADVRLARARRRSPARRLLLAAMDAFGRRGFPEVNVDDLCRAAGIAKGSFYRHYRSKEELFFAAVQAASDEVIDSFGRAVTPGRPEGAADLLAGFLEPRLPLLMELFIRAVRRRPGYAVVARRVFSELAYRIGEHLGAPEPTAAGAWVLGQAAAGAFRRTLEPSPLAAVDMDLLRA